MAIFELAVKKHLGFMSTINNKRPQAGDYAPFYGKYVDLVKGSDIIAILKKSKKDTYVFMQSLPNDMWNKRYAPGKWSVAEVFLHLMDSERIFAYRALRLGREDSTPLPGFEQDDYVPHSNAKNRTAASIAEEYLAIRSATLELLKNFTPDMWSGRGEASGHEVTVLALAFIIAGHEAHHLHIIRERYL